MSRWCALAECLAYDTGAIVQRCPAHTGFHAPSLREHVEEAPIDAILGLNVAFKADTHPNKLNLGVGAYRTAEGEPLVLDVVHKVEQEMVASKLDHEYIPIEGTADFRHAACQLLFGEDAWASGKIAVAQALSGTGSLRLAGAWIKRYLPAGTTVYLSTPTWGNHPKVFAQAEVPVAHYRYFDSATGGVDMNGMLEDMKNAPDGSAFLLHTCAHNPTGADPSQDEWKEICRVIVAKKHLAVFDTAYQGYATGDLEADAFAPRYMFSQGVEFIACTSFAKNIGLYGERVGSIQIVCASKEVAHRCLTQVKTIIRPMYSSPPKHGAEIVARVVLHPENFAQWKTELKAMSGRIVAMRKALFDRLKEIECPGIWDHIIKQIGMFTFTGLKPAQVAMLTEKYHVYLTKDGRISMAGLNESVIPYFADAVKDVVTSS